MEGVVTVPRIRQKANVYKAEDFSRAVRASLAERGLQQHDLAMELDVSDATLSLLLKDPNKISAGRLRTIVQYLDMEPLTLLLFCGFDKKRIGSYSA